jgi:hypothetical protein
MMGFKGLFTFLTQWAFFVQVYLRLNRPQTAVEGILSSIATFLQTLQVMSRLDLENPTILETFYQLLDTFTISGFFVRFRFKLDCFIQHGFRFAIYQQAVFPLIIFLNIGLLQALYFLRSRSKLNLDFVHNIVGLVFTGLFVLLVSMSLSLFYTVQMPNGRLMVVSFPELEYGSPDWLGVLPVNLFATLLYGVGTISYVTHAVLTAPRRAAAEPGFMVRFRFCFGTKRPDRWWWVLAHLAFGVCVNLLQILLPADIVQAKVCSSLVCTFMFTMIVYTVWPFKFSVTNCVETMFKVDVVILLSLATSFVDSSRLNDVSLDRVNNMWGYAIIVVILSTFAIAMYLLLKVALAYAQPIGIANVKSARTVWQLRDVACAMLLLPESNFAKRLSSIGDHDAILLQQANDRIIQIIFGQQAGIDWARQRLLPDNDHQVWDHSKNVLDTLAQMRSGELQARLKRSEHLRTRFILVADAIYSRMRGPRSKADSCSVHGVGSRSSELRSNTPRSSTPRSSTPRSVTPTMSNKKSITTRHGAVTDIIRYRSNMVVRPRSEDMFAAVSEEVARVRSGTDTESSAGLSAAPMAASTVSKAVSEVMGLADQVRTRFVSPAAAIKLTPDCFKELLSDTLYLDISDEDADAMFAVLDPIGSGSITARDITSLLSGLAPEELVAVADDVLDDTAEAVKVLEEGGHEKASNEHPGIISYQTQSSDESLAM